MNQVDLYRPCLAHYKGYRDDVLRIGSTGKLNMYITALSKNIEAWLNLQPVFQQLKAEPLPVHVANSGDNSPYPRKTTFYSSVNKDQLYISVDIVKANFNGVREMLPELFKGVEGSNDSILAAVKNNWTDFIHAFDKEKYYTPVNSKFWREKLWGLCGMSKKVHQINEFMIRRVLVAENIQPEEVVFLQGDEFVIHWTPERFAQLHAKHNNDVFKVQAFKLHQLDQYRYYVKEYFNGVDPTVIVSREMKCVPGALLLEAIKFYEGRPVNPIDLRFISESGRIASFEKSMFPMPKWWRDVFDWVASSPPGPPDGWTYEHQSFPRIPKRVWKDCGDRVTIQEHGTQRNASHKEWITLRLDINSMKSVKKRFQAQKYSTEIADAMIACKLALAKRFNAQHSFTQSDEINLVLRSKPNNPAYEHPFGGERNKLISLSAAFASSFFNLYMAKLGHYDVVVCDDPVVFDCRMAIWPTERQALQLFAWRIEDCERNGLSDAAYQHCKSWSGLNGGAKLEMLQKAQLLPLPSHQAYGNFHTTQRIKIIPSVPVGIAAAESSEPRDRNVFVQINEPLLHWLANYVGAKDVNARSLDQSEFVVANQADNGSEQS